MTDASPQVPPPLPPTTVLNGRYRLVHKLGRGATADVYLAEQVALERKVALKVIARRGPRAPEAEARFKREALLHSSIEHPSIVRILDFETDGPEGTVVVLEYVEGKRLDELCAQGPLPFELAGRLMLQLAQGLAAIHGKGIVHRDFKAENVMVSEGDGGPQARILDFGLARLFDADLLSGDGRSFVTGMGVASGTPAYLAPEQARGFPADPRSDVYAFGVTAHLMLSGELPFKGPDLADFVKQHTEATPPRLENVPGPLADFILRCLEKEASRRPSDGATLAAHLEELLPALPKVKPRPPAKAKGRGVPLIFPLLVTLAAPLCLVLAVEQPWLPAQQARWLLRAGQPARALERLGPDDAATAPARALALEALGRDDELKALIRARCAAVVAGLDAEQRQRFGLSFEVCATR